VSDRPAGDAGISLAEVLVAVTLLAVTMAATASSVVRALQVARDSREAVIAGNVVQFELERVRAIPFADWVAEATDAGGTATAVEEHDGPDGQRYRVSRSATWVPGATPSPCGDVVAGGESYVRVDQTVTWPGRDIDPVTNVTILTPRDASAVQPAAGGLAVRIVDRDGAGVEGHQVVVDGPSGLETATTGADGCAGFPALAVPPYGTAAYSVVVDTPAHVEPQRDAQRIEDTVVVSALSTAVKTYSYDRAATLRPAPTVPPPIAGCTPTVVDTGQVPIGGGGDETKSPSTPTGAPATLRRLVCTGVSPPGGWTAGIPINLGWTLRNPAATFTASGAEAWQAALGTTPPAALAPLFPYADGYTAHAGRCPTSDPELTGGQRTAAAAAPGADVAVTVPMALVTLTTTTSTGVVEGNRDVYAHQVDATSCPTGERLYLGLSDPPTGQLRAVLPYGSWVFLHREPGEVPPSTAIPCGAVTRATSCVELRADGVITELPVTGAACTAASPPPCGLTTNPLVGYEVTVRRVP
jgi:hypothetical protein